MLVVVACYALSAIGILVSIMVIFASLAHPKPSGLIALLFLYAWLVHAVMSVGWIRDRKVGRRWVVSGTLAGAISLLVWPAGTASIAMSTIQPMPMKTVIGMLGGTPLNGIQLLAGTVLETLLIPVLLVLPCLLLAIHLVRFHLRQDGGYPDDTPRREQA